MPIYEFECRQCRSRFETIVPAAETKVKCRECGSSKVTRLLSSFAVSVSSGRTPADPGPCGGCDARQRGVCGVE